MATQTQLALVLPEHQSLEQSELLQILAHFFLGVWPQGNARGDVLWLLQPQHVVNVLLLQGLSQLLQSGLISSLENHLAHAPQLPEISCCVRMISMKVQGRCGGVTSLRY